MNTKQKKAKYTIKPEEWRLFIKQNKITSQFILSPVDANMVPWESKSVVMLRIEEGNHRDKCFVIDECGDGYLYNCEKLRWFAINEDEQTEDGSFDWDYYFAPGSDRNGAKKIWISKG